MRLVCPLRTASPCRCARLAWRTFAALTFQLMLVIGAAQAALPQGTKGWVWGAFGPSVSDTPDQACREFFPLGPLHYAGIGPVIANGRWDPTRYWCKGKVSPTAEPGNYLTFLLCEDGYVPRYPGVCVKNNNPPPPPPPPSCSISAGGFALGNPVIVSNGSKFQREVDFEADRAGALDISRSYRSVFEVPRNQQLQSPWAFAFERTLIPELAAAGSPSMSVRLYAADSSEIKFTWTSQGYVTSNVEGVRLRKLSAVGDEWEYTSPDGRLDYFKKLAQSERLLLTSSFSKEGNATYFKYSLQDGKLVMDMSDGHGRAVIARWGANGVAEIIGQGISARYQYDTVDLEFMHGARLTGVTLLDPSGEIVATRKYHYEAAGQTYINWFLLTGITDENGVRFASYTYDDVGRVLVSEHTGGAEKHEFSYPSGRERVVTDPLGTARAMVLMNTGGKVQVQTIDQPGGAGCGPAASSFAYGPQGRVASRTDFNNKKTCFVYDARGLETLRREGLAGAAACATASSSPKPGERNISTQWHPDWRIGTKVAKPLKITSTIFNGQPDVDGRTLTCASGGTLPNGKPIAVVCKQIEQATTDADGRLGFQAAPVGAARVTSYTYDRLGQVLSSSVFGREPGKADTTSYAYFADTTATHTRGDLWRTVNPKGQVKEFSEYTPSALPSKIIEPNGQVALLSYDARQHLIRQVSFAGTAAEQTTQYGYDDAGLLKTTRAANGGTVAYTYDAAHRLTDVTDASGDSIHYELDAMGNRVRTEFRNSAGVVTRRTNQAFDALNRVQAVSGGAAQ